MQGPDAQREISRAEQRGDGICESLPTPPASPDASSDRPLRISLPAPVNPAGQCSIGRATVRDRLRIRRSHSAAHGDRGEGAHIDLYRIRLAQHAAARLRWQDASGNLCHQGFPLLFLQRKRQPDDRSSREHLCTPRGRRNRPIFRSSTKHQGRTPANRRPGRPSRFPRRQDQGPRLCDPQDRIDIQHDLSFPTLVCCC